MDKMHEIVRKWIEQNGPQSVAYLISNTGLSEKAIRRLAVESLVFEVVDVPTLRLRAVR